MVSEKENVRVCGGGPCVCVCVSVCERRVCNEGDCVRKERKGGWEVCVVEKERRMRESMTCQGQHT